MTAVVHSENVRECVRVRTIALSSSIESRLNYSSKKFTGVP